MIIDIIIVRIIKLIKNDFGNNSNNCYNNYIKIKSTCLNFRIGRIYQNFLLCYFALYNFFIVIYIAPLFTCIA